MSSVAVSVDVVDLNWRIFQTQEKRLTPRGRSRLTGHRRTRGHEVLEKHDGSLKHSGRRFVALARATVCDITAGAAEFFELDEDMRPARPVIGYSRCARRELRRRRKADLIEVKERQHVILSGIEDEFHRVARRRYKADEHQELIFQISWLEEQLTKPHSDAEISSLNDSLVEAKLKLFDLEVLTLYAA